MMPVTDVRPEPPCGGSQTHIGQEHRVRRIARKKEHNGRTVELMRSPTPTADK
jgi:hypothetical protein